MIFLAILHSTSIILYINNLLFNLIRQRFYKNKLQGRYKYEYSPLMFFLNGFFKGKKEEVCVK